MITDAIQARLEQLIITYGSYGMQSSDIHVFIDIAIYHRWSFRVLSHTSSIGNNTLATRWSEHAEGGYRTVPTCQRMVSPDTLIMTKKWQRWSITAWGLCTNRACIHGNNAVSMSMYDDDTYCDPSMCWSYTEAMPLDTIQSYAHTCTSLLVYYPSMLGDVSLWHE